MAAAEQKKSYAVIKQFRGLNTKANRTAIDESEFSWIENAQPIGYGNVKIIPTNSNVLDAGANTVVFANTVTHLSSVNIGLNDYVVGFMSDGSAQFFNITTDTFGNIASPGTFSASGVQITWTTVNGRSTVNTAEVEKLLGFVPKVEGQPFARLNIKTGGK
jgi:hypothetical protein